MIISTIFAVSMLLVLIGLGTFVYTNKSHIKPFLRRLYKAFWGGTETYELNTKKTKWRWWGTVFFAAVVFNSFLVLNYGFEAVDKGILARIIIIITGIIPLAIFAAFMRKEKKEDKDKVVKA